MKLLHSHECAYIAAVIYGNVQLLLLYIYSTPHEHPCTCDLFTLNIYFDC